MRKYNKIMQLELKHLYRVPFLETMIAILVFVCLMGVVQASTRGPQFNLYAHSEYNSTQTIEMVFEGFQEMTKSGFVLGPTYGMVLIVFLIPMMIAGSISRGFENDLHKTLLSYPFSRSEVLLSKIAIPIIALALPCLATSILATSILTPGYLDLMTITIVSLAFIAVCFAITSVSTVIAILSKNSLITSSIGVLTWYAILFVYVPPPDVPLLYGILNPMSPSIAFIMNPSGAVQLSEVVLSLMGCLIMAVLLVLIADQVFRYTEI